MAGCDESVFIIGSNDTRLSGWCTYETFTQRLISYINQVRLLIERMIRLLGIKLP